MFRANNSVGNTEGVEFAQDFLTRWEVFESGLTGTGDFLHHESDHSFAISVVAIATILLRNMRQKSRRDLVAVDELINLSLTVDAIDRLWVSFMIDDDFVESEMSFIDLDERVA